MNNVKVCCRVFTLFDYDKEEKWLREMHNDGWKFRKGGIFYTFDRCEPEDVIYKIDFQNNTEDRNNYLSMFRDYGWEHVMDFNKFVYFRKSADADKNNTNDELEIFSDNESKTDMMKRILLGRLLPIFVIFLCCVIPNVIRIVNEKFNDTAFSVMWIIVFLLYVFLFSKCCIGYRRNKKRIN